MDGFHSPVDLALVHLIRDYLLGHDNKSWIECVRGRASPFVTLAETQDRLGWDNFVEGRISKVLLQAVTNSLTASGSRSSPEAWCRKLIRHLLQLTHSQWIFRNSHTHLKKLDGLTIAQHEQLFDKVKSLMDIDPSDLLD